jgi:hypothetical protein
MGKALGKWSLGRVKRTWKDNIKMDIRKLGYENYEGISKSFRTGCLE